MTFYYADSSALSRAYIAGEPDHPELRALLFEGRDAVVTSEIARIEVASALRAASRAGRLPQWPVALAAVEADMAEGGAVRLIALRPQAILPAAYRLVLEHRLRTLDAVHLAVAKEDAPAIAQDDEIVFVTRDDNQAQAARKLGFTVR